MINDQWTLIIRPLGRRNYSPDRSSELQNVQLPSRILPKRADAAAGREQRAPVARIRGRILDAVDRAVAVIGIEIVAGELRQRAAAVHIAARDRAGIPEVRILNHW